MKTNLTVEIMTEANEWMPIRVGSFEEGKNIVDGHNTVNIARLVTRAAFGEKPTVLYKNSGKIITKSTVISDR